VVTAEDMMMEHWRLFAQVRHFPVTRDSPQRLPAELRRRNCHALALLDSEVGAPRAAGTAVLAAVMSQPACSAGVEEFYKGKSIS